MCEKLLEEEGTWFGLFSVWFRSEFGWFEEGFWFSFGLELVWYGFLRFTGFGSVFGFGSGCWFGLTVSGSGRRVRVRANGSTGSGSDSGSGDGLKLHGPPSSFGLKGFEPNF